MKLRVVILFVIMWFCATLSWGQGVSKGKRFHNKQFQLQHQDYFKAGPIHISYRAYVDLPISIHLLNDGKLIESKNSLLTGKGFNTVTFKNIDSGIYTCLLVSSGRILDKILVRVVD